MARSARDVDISNWPGVRPNIMRLVVINIRYL